MAGKESDLHTATAGAIGDIHARSQPPPPLPAAAATAAATTAAVVLSAGVPRQHRQDTHRHTETIHTGTTTQTHKRIQTHIQA